VPDSHANGHRDPEPGNVEDHSPPKMGFGGPNDKPVEIIIPPNNIMLTSHCRQKDLEPTKIGTDREYRLAKVKEGTIQHPEAIIWDLPLKIELWKFNLDFSAENPNKEMQSYFELVSEALKDNQEFFEEYKYYNLVRHIWGFSQKQQLVQFWLTFLPFVILYGIAFVLDEHRHESIITIASGIGIILVTLLLTYEFLQMLSTGFRKYITDGQNILDVITYISYINIFVWLIAGDIKSSIVVHLYSWTML
jgi:hypothetical protein